MRIKNYNCQRFGAHPPSSRRLNYKLKKINQQSKLMRRTGRSNPTETDRDPNS